MTIESIIIDFSYDELSAAYHVDMQSYYFLLSYIGAHDDEGND